MNIETSTRNVWYQKQHRMKKNMTILLFAAAITSANAQFEKGLTALGGSLNFSLGKTTNEPTGFSSQKNTAVVIAPSLAKFNKSNELTGGAISYSFNKAEYNSPTGNYQSDQMNNIGISFFKQRFFPLGQKVFFTANANLGAAYGFGKSMQQNAAVVQEQKKTSYSAALGLTPGLSYRLTNHWLLEATLANLASISFTHQKSRQDPSSANPNDVISNSLSLNSSLSNASLGNIGLGFRWLFSR